VSTNTGHGNAVPSGATHPSGPSIISNIRLPMITAPVASSRLPICSWYSSLSPRPLSGPCPSGWGAIIHANTASPPSPSGDPGPGFGPVM
jgi:hypothetical protein